MDKMIPHYAKRDKIAALKRTLLGIIRDMQ